MSAIRQLTTALLCAGALCAAGSAAAEVQSIAAIAGAAEQHARSDAQRQGYRDIQTRALSLDTRLKLQACGHALDTFASPGRSVGRTTVGVRCHTPKPWTLYVPVEVKASVNTVVLRDTTARGTVLAASDLRLEKRPADSLHGGTLSTVDAAVGKQLRRNLRAGTTLRLSMLDDPQAIARGQSTLLLSVINNIEVVMSGTALTGGAAGDTIKVRNTQSGRLLEGVVLDDGRVLVN